MRGGSNDGKNALPTRSVAAGGCIQFLAMLMMAVTSPANGQSDPLVLPDRIHGDIFHSLRDHVEVFRLENQRYPTGWHELTNFTGPEMWSDLEKRLRRELGQESRIGSVFDLVLFPNAEVTVTNRQGWGHLIALGSIVSSGTNPPVRRRVLFEDASNSNSLTSAEMLEASVRSSFQAAGIPLPPMRSYPSAVLPPSARFQAMMQRPFNPPAWQTNAEPVTNSSQDDLPATKQTDALPRIESDTEKAVAEHRRGIPRPALLIVGSVLTLAFGLMWWPARKS